LLSQAYVINTALKFGAQMMVLIRAEILEDSMKMKEVHILFAMSTRIHL
jgi:hypothetical protein